MQDLKDSKLKIKSQNSQLCFLLNENESLRGEISQLKSSLSLTQESIAELSASKQSKALIALNK